MVTLFFVQIVVSTVHTTYPAVLGSSIDMSAEKILELTNSHRDKEHLEPLTMNETLAEVASMKADYMFEKNFWAHNGPDGTTPWYFFKKAGYTYIYAGENLARGFNDSDEVVNAWMNSPTHRENMLSPHYKEIGFAIKKGKLLGEDTILIVEEFGSRDVASIANTPQTQPSVKNFDILPAATAPIQKQEAFGQSVQNATDAIKTSVVFDSKTLSSSVGMLVLATFIFLLILDIIIIERKKIARVVGHNADHILFLSAILIIMVLSIRGIVL